MNAADNVLSRNECVRLLGVSALFVCGFVAWPEVGSGQETVDFNRDIRPILKMHCYECHGPGKQSGGLTFHSKADAAFGGDSGGSLVIADLEANELYSRVTSDDETIRMPKGHPALSAGELELIKRWVVGGAQWADPSPEAEGPDAESELPEGLPDESEIETEQVKAIPFWDSTKWLLHPHLQYYIFAVGIFTAIIAVTETWKYRIRQGHPWTRGKFGWVFKPFVWFTPVAYLLLLVLVGAGIVFDFAIWHRADQLSESYQLTSVLQKSIKRQRQALAKYSGDSSVTSIFGNPPVPLHPSHGKRLAGTYYRGNCERSPELFNNGNYLTAKLHVGLFNADREPVDYGEPVTGRMWIRFEIERAAFAAPRLYEPKVMETVFLSQDYLGNEEAKLPKDAIYVDEKKQGEDWVAWFPVELEMNEGQATADGIVYVYKGRITEQRAQAAPHYGIRYVLNVEEGRLAETSEIYMNALFVSGNVAPPIADKIPFNEWFDDKPIPEIVDGNTDDPKLLGLEEHLPGSTTETPDGGGDPPENETAGEAVGPEERESEPAAEEPRPSESGVESDEADDEGAGDTAPVTDEAGDSES